MNKFSTLFSVPLICMWFTLGISAEDHPTNIINHGPENRALTKAEMPQTDRMSNISLQSNREIISVNPTATNISNQFKQKPQKSAPTSVNDLVGEWVQTYATLVYPGADGGNSVTIEAIENEPDSITFINFYDTGVSVKAFVDFNNKKLTIKNQNIFHSSTFGWLDIAAVQIGENGPTPDRSSLIEGKINDDGSISLLSPWGIFGTEGANADKYAGVFTNTIFERANATMSQKRLVGSPDNYENFQYNVIATYKSKNILSVKNFGNYGMTVDLVLNQDQTATIEAQVARIDPSGDNYYTNAIMYDPASVSVTAYSSKIVTEASTDTKTIRWNDWTLTNSTSYLGILTEGQITTTFDINYPTLSVSDFNGQGTADNPYLISTIDDLVLLSNKVNNVSEADYNATTSDGVKYSLAFTNKYFRLTSDLDMTGYRFTPIGRDWYHHFGGIFDGANHTITGLDISTGDDGYAALFGRAGESSVIKNLIVENPIIQSKNYYAAVIAGWSDGIIDNCHIQNATVNNEGRATGGIAAIIRTIRNSSITKSSIIGLGGNTGGVASEVDALIENCNATETVVKVNAPAENYNAGGLVASLYKASAKGCYFSGTIDSQTYQIPTNAGGIAGICYHGNIENCFSVGTVSGYGANASLGGIAGILQGTLTNSYSIGNITDELSKNVGGIVGRVQSYTDENNTTKQSLISNCYTSTVVTANTELYDMDTDFREAVGTTDENTTPEISNILFDKQITSFGSTNYGATTEQLTRSNGISGFDATVWTFTEGQYPRLKGIDENEAAYMGASVIQMQNGNALSKISKDVYLKPMGNTTYHLLKDGQLTDDGQFSQISENILSIKENFGTDTLVISNGSISTYYPLNITPIPFEGDGTQESPYLLKTKEDIIKLADISNIEQQYFSNTYFRFTNDIDMEYDTRFDGICSDPKNVDSKFSGKIDGAGYSLKRMLLDRVLWKTRPEDDTTGQGGSPDNMNSRLCGGFVGRLAVDGEIRNLTIAADCKLQFWSQSGPIAAYNWGLIDNCRNYATVTSYSNIVGGIVGRNELNGKVTNCYNAGDVFGGYDTAGGITGYNYGFIENCANTGTVEIKSISQFMTNTKFLNTAGGITGNINGGVIRNVVNAGQVYAVGSKAGGISGSYPKVIMSDVSGKNDMYNAINLGIVESGNKVYLGALAGDTGTEGTIQNNYWDNQILPLKAIGNQDMDGMTGVETQVLTSGTALTGFDTAIWDFTAGQYPILKQFANEEKLQKARKTIVSMESGITANDVNKDATLADEEGLTWTLKQNNSFSISDNILHAPKEVTELTVDTLIAEFGDYRKLIKIRRIPNIPLSGMGTTEDPYLITSTTDWNNLSDYMTTIGESLLGKSLKLTDNIDFTDTEFKMLAADGITRFEGNLDGNGMTISDINFTTTETEQGAIRIVGENGVISNLTLQGEITSSVASTGGFTGSVYGTLNNCVNEININSSRGNGTAGFGILYGSAQLTDCVNKGTISGAGTNIAGIASEVEAGARLIRCSNEGKIINNGTGNYTAGLIGTSYPIYLEECYNDGEIEITNTNSTKNIAGLIGFATSSSSVTNTMELVRCYNTADISGAAAVAGLIASTTATSSIINPILMTECYNTGNITAQPEKVQSSSSSPTAGIIAFYTPGSQISKCWNSGTISSINVYTAGIAAYYRNTPTEQYPVIISDCYNTGEINTTGDNGAGILAYGPNFVGIERCYNTANISGDFGFGGIAGRFDGVKSSIKNCWNSGDVTVLTNRAGGIVGYGTTQCIIENCFNVGNISSSSTTGGTSISVGYGIGGLAGQSGATFTNCYNMGTITGPGRVGGLIGVPCKSITQIVRSYNAGKIVAEADTCGALIGVNLSNTTLWNENNKVENSYFVTDYGTYDNNTVGTATTIAELATIEMGAGWVSGDNYTLPIPSTLTDVPEALVNAVTIAFAQGDSPTQVTQNFFVGAPSGLTWTSSVPNITIMGTDATFSDDEFVGKAILTATAGDCSKAFEIECNKAESNINSMEAGKTVIEEVWYNTKGMKVQKPAYYDGDVYIVIRKYDDQSTKVVKIFNAK